MTGREACCMTYTGWPVSGLRGGLREGFQVPAVSGADQSSWSARVRPTRSKNVPGFVLRPLIVGAVLFAAVLTGCSSPPPLSVDEYVVWCQSLQEKTWSEPEQGDTNQGLSLFLAAVIEEMNSVVPPAEIADWHDKNIAAVQVMKEFFDAQPMEDAPPSYPIVPGFLPVAEEIEEIQNDLAPDVYELLEDGDCLFG